MLSTISDQKSARSSQRGIFFPLLLVVVGIVFVYSVQSLFMSRQNLNVTVRLACQDMLYQAALGALEATEAELAGFISSLGTDSDLSSNPIFGPVAASFIDPAGLPRVAEFEKTVDLPVFAILAGKAGEGVTLGAAVSLAGVRPVLTPGSFTAIPGDREKNFELKISATAIQDGISVTVVSFTRGRLVLTHVPPFSKFTLMLRSQAGFEADGLAEPTPGPTGTGLFGPPMVLDNGRVVGEGETFERNDLADLLGGQGFVFLGGGTWELGHSSGGTSDSMADAGLDRRIFFYDMPSPPPTGPPDMKFYSRAREVSAATMAPEGGEFMKNAQAAKLARSSFVRLFGTRSEPSPTVVFGTVERRFILEQGLGDPVGERVAPLPYMPDSGAFDSWGWPQSTGPDARDFVYRQLFSGDYDVYSRRMSRLVLDDYNRGHLSFLKVQDPRPSMWPDETPGGPLPIPGVTAGGAAILAGAVIHAGSITLRGCGEVLFDGDPWGEDIAGHLAKRTCYSHKSGAGFLRNRTSAGSLRLKGIEKVTGRLVIDRRLVVPRGMGGVILATGDIVVSAPVDCEAGAHLYLVSLGGDLMVDTTLEIEACLAAPKGKILLPAAFSIKGGIAATAIHPDSFKPTGAIGPGAKTLDYDEDLDVTRPEVLKGGYRFVLRENWERYVR